MHWIHYSQPLKIISGKIREKQHRKLNCQKTYQNFWDGVLESLMRRKLIHHRPINFMSAVYDGVIVDHPAWFPVEVYATPLVWEYHKDDIMKYLFGKQRSDKE